MARVAYEGAAGRDPWRGVFLALAAQDGGDGDFVVGAAGIGGIQAKHWAHPASGGASAFPRVKVPEGEGCALFEGFGPVIRVALFHLRSKQECPPSTSAPSFTIYPTHLMGQAAIDAWVDQVAECAAKLEAVLAAREEEKSGEGKKQKKKKKKSAAGGSLEDANAAIEALLDSAESQLLQRTYLAGERLSVADLAVFAVARSFFLPSSPPSAASRPSVMRWMETCSPTFLPFFEQADGALEKERKQTESQTQKKQPKKAKDQQPKQNGHPKQQDPAQSQAPQGGSKDGAEEDPVKKAKKAAKAAEKEAKKAKALAKAAARKKAEEEKKNKGSSGDDKASKKNAKANEAEQRRLKAKEEEDAALEFVRSVPAGEKKDLSKTSTVAAYNPRIVEACWYDWWEKSEFFKPDPKKVLDKSKKPYVIVIPPPNVTGTLHLGHALTGSIEDTIVRWKRMSGYEVCWVPGTDHAGIATQTVVERKLMREEGKTRHDLGREAFLEQVHAFAKEKKDTILGQVRRLGSSVDWSRERFTMDEDLQVAVREAFCVMHEKGLIYRDSRLVNWCCHLNTALSDIELDYIDVPGKTMLSVPGYNEGVEFGVLTSFAYKLEDGSGELVVATTRIETMLGDTAVAVHPDDKKYKHVHGKHVIHPVNGRRIPIITDAILVDMDFGTGAVKITPAHDPNDFATGQRHNLEFINVFDDNGCLNGNGTGQFEGMKRFEVRKKIVEFLDSKGLFRGKQDNEMRLALCSRSKDVIEPMLKPQWWVNCKEMGEDACQVVRSRELNIVPKEFERTWFNWMENIRDWCISRQLWWGHRIPAYYVKFEGESDEHGIPGRNSERAERWVVGRTAEEATKRAKAKFPGKNVTVLQDEDVLDTWFSSGLFPFSVFKWPNNSEDLDAFFPTSLLETGHDILFFWVARMVMMSRFLTGKLPFKDVFLHAMVRDAHGRKMSKSLGNVIDPISVIEGITLEQLHQTLMGGNLDPKEVEKAKAGQASDYPNGIEECGTDALRFALVAYTLQGRDVNLDVKRVVGYRHWCNKLWNALRFAMMNLGDNYQPPTSIVAPKSLPVFCRWILSRLNNTVASTVSCMENWEFSRATSAIHHFWQYDLCDVFIELMKPVMQSGDEGTIKHTRDTLWACLEIGLRLLHPFMPFLTEELWQRLPKTKEYASEYPSIMVSRYPECSQAFVDDALEKGMTYANVVVNQVRSLRTSYGLTNNKQKPEVYLHCATGAAHAALAPFGECIGALTNASKLHCVTSTDKIPAGCGVAIVDEAVTAHVVLTGLIDPQAEVKRLGKKMQDAEKKKTAMDKKMKMPDYESKTPAKIKEENLEKLQKINTEISNINDAIAGFQKLAI